MLTDTQGGEVLAMVGARAADAHGFNRALTAQRPVGSLIKPFVYLLALAQPGRWSLASMVEDAPLNVRLAGGKSWSPDNVDNVSHGWVTLLDALSHSYNQATVRIGLDVGVERLTRAGPAELDQYATESQMEVPADYARWLPAAQQSVRVTSTERGRRIVVTLTWDQRPGVSHKPVVLEGWSLVTGGQP